MFWENIGNKSYKEIKIDTMDFECVNAIYKNNSLLILGKNNYSQYFFREYIFENGKWITTSEFENGYLSTTFNNPDSIYLKLIGEIITHYYLLPLVREKGGAYDCR